MPIRSFDNYDQDSVLWAKARLYFHILISRLKPGVSHNPNSSFLTINVLK